MFTHRRPLCRAACVLVLFAMTADLRAFAAGCAPAGWQESAAEPLGICHKVLRGQTLYSISRAYQIDLDTMADINRIQDPGRIEAGRLLFIPGATAPLDVSPTLLTPLLSWPLDGQITSAFGVEGGRPHHEGIDIDGVKGELIRAAAAGKVVWAGTERGYGNMVVLDHGGGLSTVYAHAERLLVGSEQWVSAGEPVAQVGDTGNARGAHLHFEVRRDGRPLNPMPLLGGSVAHTSAGGH
ncbi:MAG TPA: LysM peptidoglycan-binding domain-containing M23 family metallopeptidase [Candidatus Polarisedimenticolia bacterium]|nr:LysM peptidoglycan-binding domain-containing M23 family metallopeptidase [Candidatus Polarisedimenticolia bacterium]